MTAMFGGWFWALVWTGLALPVLGALRASVDYGRRNERTLFLRTELRNKGGIPKLEMFMTQRVELQVDDGLAAFIENEALPGTGVDASRGKRASFRSPHPAWPPERR